MGACVIAYLDARDDWWEAVLRTLCCPTCRCRCRRHSVRTRAAWTQFLLRTDERIPVLRIYCPQCRRTYTVLPDFLTPRHRYQVPVREAVCAGTAPAPACGAQTVTRWTRAFQTAIPRAIQHVTSRILHASVPVGRQDRRFLTGELHGYRGLQQGRRIAAQSGLDTVASSLFGWVNQTRDPKQAFVI